MQRSTFKLIPRTPLELLVELDQFKLERLDLNQLKSLCDDRDLLTTGPCNVLIERLIKWATITKKGLIKQQLEPNINQIYNQGFKDEEAMIGLNHLSLDNNYQTKEVPQIQPIKVNPTLNQPIKVKDLQNQPINLNNIQHQPIKLNNLQPQPIQVNNIQHQPIQVNNIQHQPIQDATKLRMVNEFKNLNDYQVPSEFKTQVQFKGNEYQAKLEYQSNLPTPTSDGSNHSINYQTKNVGWTSISPTHPPLFSPIDHAVMDNFSILTPKPVDNYLRDQIIQSQVYATPHPQVMDMTQVNQIQVKDNVKINQNYHPQVKDSTQINQTQNYIKNIITNDIGLAEDNSDYHLAKDGTYVSNPPQQILPFESNVNANTTFEPSFHPQNELTSDGLPPLRSPNHLTSPHALKPKKKAGSIPRLLDQCLSPETSLPTNDTPANQMPSHFNEPYRSPESSIQSPCSNLDIKVEQGYLNQPNYSSQPPAHKNDLYMNQPVKDLASYPDAHHIHHQPNLKDEIYQTNPFAQIEINNLNDQLNNQQSGKDDLNMNNLNQNNIHPNGPRMNPFHQVKEDAYIPSYYLKDEPIKLQQQQQQVAPMKTSNPFQPMNNNQSNYQLDEPQFKSVYHMGSKQLPSDVDLLSSSNQTSHNSKDLGSGGVLELEFLDGIYPPTKPPPNDLLTKNHDNKDDRNQFKAESNDGPIFQSLLSEGFAQGLQLNNNNANNNPFGINSDHDITSASTSTPIPHQWNQHNNPPPPGFDNQLNPIQENSMLNEFNPTTLLSSNQLDKFLQGPGKGICKIDFNDLVFGRKLGAGGYKDCFAGIYKGEEVAIGELRVTQFTPADFQEIKNEIEVIQQLVHENIVKFIGVAKGPTKLSIVTELCHLGDLYDYMKTHPKPIFQQQISLMHDITLAVNYLHTRRPRIIHRDLKSMNILITNGFKAKLTDFGLARIRKNMLSPAHTQCGTPNWQAPEMFGKQVTYTEKVDVYAVGLMFWEILQWGVEPFPFWNVKEDELSNYVANKGQRPSLQNLSTYPPSLLTLMTNMWAHTPDQRPSMNQVEESISSFLH